MVKISEPIPLEKTTQKRIKISPPHSPEVHDILTKMPSWIIRWGITVLFFLVLMLIVLSWFVKYPDVVKTEVVINTTEVPTSVVVRANGALNILVQENEYVAEGDLLGYIKNPAELEDVQALQYTLMKLPQLKDLNEYWRLGTLQPYFNELVVSLKKARNIQKGFRDDLSRKELIQQQLKEVVTGRNKAQKEIQLAQQAYDFAQKTLESRYQKLLLQDVISKEAYEQHALKVLNLKKEVERLKTTLNETNKQSLLLKKEAQNIEFNRGMESVDAQNEIEDAYSRLHSHIALWEQKYLMDAPISGQVQYLDFAKENMYVQTDQEVARIIPEEQGALYGEMFIPANGFGKVDTGQIVLIELAHYLKKEYGMLEGKIIQISPIGTKKGYKSTVSLKNELTTTFKKDLEFRHGMEGKGQIITEDIRLLHRFLFQLREVFSTN
ncbi:MAG: HlyD family secretion protein [Saprospiraceae bacterium]